MKEPEQNSSGIPDSVLNNINEWCLAFTLCYIDQNGIPSIISRSDNVSFFIAMQTTLKSWVEAHEEISKNCNIQEIVGDFEGCEIDPDEED